ncbi:bifunctional glycosyltransferase/CDP-glycerol:glycerophosphate glycerophosphotransferase [Phytohabitans aurantiacus]|uniref:Glycosyl transferase n=1 Tax=Phytohabitans aurantiacus TaxID=3016789 RepID=A0ABQ5QV48_9ACTN|nr:bifunctional glycosyltransferase family 2 protein/CDP-glycerol:glycerophosphate glycerophosphotransferase [Phytohabitans aurantiacus]GLH98456.1 glycosyl transferase [Phytohabitans aurantiacus]
MTLISIVLPVYRVQGYLRECLDSILRQSFTGVEVIAVDDCSPDTSGEILAEYAAHDPRVRVVSLSENVGLGEARNIGLDQATGEYVWFIDSDDWLADGALGRVAARLIETAPDMLIVDHVRAYWDNRTVGSSLAQVFPEPPGVFSVRERPEVLRLLHTAWNRIMRREFLVGLGLRFGPGWYEDVSFTFPLLLKASRIAVLDRVCVNYRQRRTGAITRTRGERHFEVFPHWHRVFELIDEWGDEVDALRPLIFERMIWHYLTVLGNGNRISPDLRHRFFDQIVEDYRRWYPAGGYAQPSGADGLKHRLVSKGQWRTFTVLRAAARYRTRLRSMARKGKQLSQRAAMAAARAAHHAVMRVYYHLQLRLPRDPALAVYGAYWYRGYACNPAAIYEKARELAPDVRGLWVVRRDKAAAMPPGVDYVIAGSRRYYRALARATWLINNVNFPDLVVKRRGSVHVQTHHGTPVKVMGLDQQRYPVGAAGTDFAHMLRRCDRWDYSITSNSFSTQMWERAYPCDYETLEVGYPRNDRLANATPADVAAARERLGIGAKERVVLYAPTYRDAVSHQPMFEYDELAELLGPDGRLLVRGHYFTSRRKRPLVDEATRAGSVQDVTEYPSVEDLYLAADVLVTDYSSAMFDYAILDRPIVIYAPDWAEYRLLRGAYFDITEEPPGVVAQTFSDLLDAFRSGAVDGDAAAKVRADFRRRFCHRDDGNAAERVVRRVLLGERP